MTDEKLDLIREKMKRKKDIIDRHFKAVVKRSLANKKYKDNKIVKLPSGEKIKIMMCSYKGCFYEAGYINFTKEWEWANTRKEEREYMIQSQPRQTGVISGDTIWLSESEISDGVKDENKEKFKRHNIRQILTTAKFWKNTRVVGIDGEKLVVISSLFDGHFNYGMGYFLETDFTLRNENDKPAYFYKWNEKDKEFLESKNMAYFVLRRTYEEKNGGKLFLRWEKDLQRIADQYGPYEA